jgi:GNAT superfamily N-acetyltransferase
VTVEEVMAAHAQDTFPGPPTAGTSGRGADGEGGREQASGLALRAATAADSALVLALTLAAYEEYRGVLVPESGVFGETLETVRSYLEGGVGQRGPGGVGQRGPQAAATSGAPDATDRAVPARSGAVIASVDGTAVGCARWAVRPDDAAPGAGQRDDGTTRLRTYLYVGRVSVLPAFRGRGVATALMAWCERLAVDRGLHEVRLGVRLGLVRNEALYRRLGYRPTGSLEERAGYGQIARWMAKSVGDGAV